MATLIPAMSACTSRMTGGERRVAQRLENKLDADYLSGTTCRWALKMPIPIFASCILAEAF